MVMDYVDDMAALMHACDLAILKSGGLTLTECLCAELPMLLDVYKRQHVRASEVLFCGGGTEANVLALIGLAEAARAADRRRDRVVVSAIEHDLSLIHIWTKSSP